MGKALHEGDDERGQRHADDGRHVSPDVAYDVRAPNASRYKCCGPEPQGVDPCDYTRSILLWHTQGPVAGYVTWYMGTRHRFFIMPTAYPAGGRDARALAEGG